MVLIHYHLSKHPHIFPNSISSGFPYRYPFFFVARCRSRKMITVVAYLCCTICSGLFRRRLKGFRRKTILWSVIIVLFHSFCLYVDRTWMCVTHFCHLLFSVSLANGGSDQKSHLSLETKFAIYSTCAEKLN